MADSQDDVPLTTNDTSPAPASDAPAAPAPDTEGTPPPVSDDTPPEQPAKPAETPPEGEPPQGEPKGAETPEEDPKEQARKGYAERQRMKSAAKEAITQQYQPRTAEDLEQEGLSPEDARFEALRQEVQAERFVNNVADLTANMNMDASAIESEFDIFSEKSPNFDKDFAEKVSREYVRDAGVQMDETGQYVLSSRIPMYDYFKSRYDDRMAGQKHGQVSGQRAAEKMLASAETPSSATPPPKPAEDPIEKGFNKVFGG